MDKLALILMFLFMSAAFSPMAISLIWLSILFYLAGNGMMYFIGYLQEDPKIQRISYYFSLLGSASVFLLAYALIFVF